MAMAKRHAIVNLHHTPFIEYLSHHSRGILEQLHRDRATSRLVYRRPPTSAEEYVRECILSAGELMTTCEQLGYAIAYLSGYRRRTALDGKVISRADWVAYNIEGFLTRVSSISDRALKLVNIAFQLGIPARECRLGVIAHNSHVAATPVRKELLSLEGALKPHRSTRNSIIHHKRYSDEELEQVELYYLVEKDATYEGDPLLERFRVFYKSQTDRYVKAKRLEFLDVRNQITDRVATLFESLLPIVQRIHTRLNSRVE